MVNALDNLSPPNKNLSDAIEIRQKIDLIIGSSFTRIQTLTLRDVFQQKNINIQQNKKNQSYLMDHVNFQHLILLLKEQKK